ncbi:urease accessory protein UreF [Marinibacterium profundimaris]|uniref:Urease accessory protein UreF n=1 Tax=Marinibacterium profundimaris TaxID=1679460 RepID=A0A225NCD5_9RHOB|nr:urease accessory protein UreF [Marinibacterium profundimaris]OWU68728.1 urease accessory protein UreF [Marinibacterium profundimaris]
MSAGTDLLVLAQWLSPAYPVGAFAYSHGFEMAVAEGRVTDADSFGAFLDDVLRHGSGRTDAILLVAAHAAQTAGDPDQLAEIDALARALAPSRERATETELQGAAFAETTAAIWGCAPAPRAYPVAVGSAAATRGLPLEATLQFYLHAFASNLTAAATRLVPLGQTEAQARLAATAPTLAELARMALSLTLDDLGSSAFLADISSMRHETLYSRMFRS